MAERVIFENRAERDGASVRFHHAAAGLFAPRPFRARWSRAWPFPMLVPLGQAARRRHRLEIRRALEALQQMYAELYGSDDSAAGH